MQNLELLEVELKLRVIPRDPVQAWEHRLIPRDPVQEWELRRLANHKMDQALETG